MNAVAIEMRQALDMLERVEVMESVAVTFPQQDSRRSVLLGQVKKDLTSAAPLRPRIAAELLGLSEKTVRAWVADGVLTRAEQPSPRVLLDVARVHHVLHLLRDLRAAGQTAGLLDEVHRRLVDATWLSRTDLAESLDQMRRGEGSTRVARRSA